MKKPIQTLIVCVLFLVLGGIASGQTLQDGLDACEKPWTTDYYINCKRDSSTPQQRVEAKEFDDFEEFETVVKSKQLTCIYTIGNEESQVVYRFDGTNVFGNEKRLSDIKQKPGREIFIHNEYIPLYKSKLRHFIDFENSKAIIKSLTGFTAGTKYIGLCVPH